MKHTSVRGVIALAVVVSVAPAAHGELISVVDPTTLEAPYLVDFEDVAGGIEPGTNYDGILVSGGVSFAERFVGQTLSFSGVFDVLAGPPTGPLALQPGAANRNLNVVDFGSHVMDGLGQLGYPDLNAIGPGAVAVLFPLDQSQLAIEILGTDEGIATFDFFRRDGSLIERIVLSDLADGAVGFLREGDVRDIAGYSIINEDPGGIAYDNLRYNVIPEPSSIGLACLGLATVLVPWLRRHFFKHMAESG